MSVVNDRRVCFGRVGQSDGGGVRSRDGGRRRAALNECLGGDAGVRGGKDAGFRESTREARSGGKGEIRDHSSKTTAIRKTVDALPQ